MVGSNQSANGIRHVVVLRDTILPPGGHLAANRKQATAAREAEQNAAAIAGEMGSS